MTDTGEWLAPIAAAAALGDSEALARALDAALAHACARGAIREAVLMLAPFGGFPRTLDALTEMRAAFERAGALDTSDGGPPAQSHEPQSHEPQSREPQSEERESRAPIPSLPFAERGRALFGRVYGPDAEKVLERLTSLDSELPSWVLEDAYGRVLSRPGLAAAERERLAVVFLCALRLPNQLSGHVRGALRCGATASEVERSLAAAEPLLLPALVMEARRVLRRAASSGEE